MSLPEKHLPNLEQLKTVITRTRLDLNTSVSKLIDAIQTELENYGPAIQSYSATVKVNDWQSGEAGFFVEIANQAISTTDLAIVLLDESGKAAASQAGLSTTCETLAGKIRLTATSKPAADLNITYWIDKGKGAS